MNIRNAGTTKGKTMTKIQTEKMMAAANGVLAELVRTGQVANNREAKMKAYEVIFGMMIEA
jgi:hypothetical protein